MSSHTVTRAELEGRLRILSFALSELLDVPQAELRLELEAWAPGDGATRYRVQTGDGGRPLGTGYELGPSAALTALEHGIDLCRFASARLDSRRPRPSVCSNGSCGSTALEPARSLARRGPRYGWRCMDCSGLTVFDPELVAFHFQAEPEPEGRP